MGKNRAFTLIEILIVVILLGVLAAIVIPRFSNATAAARASMLKDNMRILRTQIPVYQGQHLGVPPGHPDGDRNAAPTEEAFVAQLTQASTDRGATAAPGTDGYNLGPYMAQIPANPVNGKSTVQIISGNDAIPAPDDSHGWIYRPSSMTFMADCSGSDEDGRSYADY